MKLTIGQLRRGVRRILENGVDTEMRNMSGFFMAGGVSSNVTDREAILNAPPQLGDPSEHEDELEDDSNVPQEKSQLAARYADRHAARKI